MTTPTLQVDPSALHSASQQYSGIAKDIGGLGVGASLSSTAGSLTGLACASACQQAGATADSMAEQLSKSWSGLSTNIDSAAKQYENTDSDASGDLNKSGEKMDENKDDGKGHDTTKIGEPGPAKAIPLEDVTYEQGDWPSGSDATSKYIDQALDARGVTDPAARERWKTAYMTLIDHESSYLPNAVNDWDSNAQKSTATVSDGYGNWCSRGLAQCIPQTFAQYHQPGTSNDIYDPVANISASMNYLEGQYGVAADGSDILAKVGQANPGTRQGY